MATADNPTSESFSVKYLWQDSPGAFKGGVVLAVVSWFISIASSQHSTTNGVLTSCSYLDFFKVGGGALVVVLAVGGFLANSRKTRHALPAAVAGVIAAVLVVVGALLVLRGMAVYPACESLVEVK